MSAESDGLRTTPLPARAGGIARVWRGVTVEGKDADAYFEHVTRTVLPALTRIPGHRGAQVLRRSTGAEIEFVVMTLWDSMEAIRAFAGDDLERAIVEPDARAALTDFEKVVRHYEVIHDTVSPGSDP